MNNNHTELPHRKRFRDESPAALSSQSNKNKGQGALITQDPLPSTQPNEKGAGQNEHLHLCPNPNNPVTLEKEQDAEPYGVMAEHSVSDSTPRKRKRKKNNDAALASSEGEQLISLRVESELRKGKEKSAESCEVKVRAVQPQVCHKHDLANPVVQEKGNFVELKETSEEQPQLCNKQNHELVNKVVEPRKENRVGKNEVAGEEPKESNNAEHTQHVIPMGPEVPSDPEQKLSKKKRRKKKKNSVLNNEVVEPDIISILPIAASQTDQKLSTDSATPIDQEQKKSKKKRRKKKKSALKSEGSESDEHNTESTAEIPVSEDNVEQPANSQLRRSEQLKGNKDPSHKECMACRQPGHKLKNCPNIDAICFFCGKIGHSLANCSASQAGGQFAWCLFCYSHGHFTNKCPRNGHGIDPKVVAANGSVHKTVEA